ncbi:rCG44805 [Rattus norvegicus]|uniref:RCG44805 n=1 Tax=Rattus norvegicus TaxID=10116 RepID=A6I4L1_RAT|nr:rCG44805 [Rattus norvegicus]
MCSRCSAWSSYSSAQLEQGIFLKLLSVCGICSTSWAALSGFSEEEAPNSTKT